MRDVEDHTVRKESLPEHCTALAGEGHQGTEGRAPSTSFSGQQNGDCLAVLCPEVLKWLPALKCNMDVQLEHSHVAGVPPSYAVSGSPAVSEVKL